MMKMMTMIMMTIEKAKINQNMTTQSRLTALDSEKTGLKKVLELVSVRFLVLINSEIILVSPSPIIKQGDFC